MKPIYLWRVIKHVTNTTYYTAQYKKLGWLRMWNTLREDVTSKYGTTTMVDFVPKRRDKCFDTYLEAENCVKQYVQLLIPVQKHAHVESIVSKGAIS